MNNNFRFSIFLSLLLISNFAFEVFSREKKNNDLENQYFVAAYIWPSCHHDERFGDMLWPEGIGEWEVIKKGTPRFEGHYQPRLPLWGCLLYTSRCV